MLQGRLCELEEAHKVCLAAAAETTCRKRAAESEEEHQRQLVGEAEAKQNKHQVDPAMRSAEDEAKLAMRHALLSIMHDLQ